MGWITAAPYTTTAPFVDLRRFLGIWYIIAGRTTVYERDAHNTVESYHWNCKKNRIEIVTDWRMKSFIGKAKRLRQQGSVTDSKTNARWKVRSFWPMSWEYLILDLAADYSWAAIGVPNQKYLWIMAQEPEMSDTQLGKILTLIGQKGYATEKVMRVPHRFTIDERIRLHTLDAAS